MAGLGYVLLGLGSLLKGVSAMRETRSPDLRMPTDRLRSSLDARPRTRRRGRMRLAEVKTLDQRVAYIRKMTVKGRDDPDIRMMTARLLSQKCGPRWCIAERDDGGEINAIFNAFKRHVRYTRDPDGVDLFQHPLRVFQSGAADCDDASITLGAMLMSVGFQVKLRVIRTHDSTDWNHIYVLAGVPQRDPKKWVPLDPTVQNARPGWEPPAAMVAQKRDFPVR